MIIRSYDIPTLAKGEFSLELPENARFLRLKYVDKLDATSYDKVVGMDSVNATPTALFVVDTEAKPVLRTFKLVKIEEEITGTYIATTLNKTDDTYLYLFEV